MFLYTKFACNYIAKNTYFVKTMLQTNALIISKPFFLRKQMKIELVINKLNSAKE